MIEEYAVNGTGTVLAEGRAVGTKVASGRARLITNARGLSEFKDGEVLVADTTTPDWEPVMKRAAAVVTNRGGRTCHAAIVARELGIPAVVGAEGATTAVPDGAADYRLLCRGRRRPDLQGEVPFTVQTTDLATIERPYHRSHDQPGESGTGVLPCRNCRLTASVWPGWNSSSTSRSRRTQWRCSTPIGSSIRASDVPIEAMVAGWPSGGDFFVTRLAEGVGTIAAAFWPRPVIVRMSTSRRTSTRPFSAERPLSRTRRTRC